MRIGIVGGGIGGLMSGALLRGDGHEVTIFERSAVLKEVGAGIGLLSNGVKALGELFSEPPFGDRVAMSTIAISTAAGRDLVDLPYAKLSEVLGFPGYILPRTALQRVLLDRAGESDVRTGAHVEAVVVDGDRPAVCLADGTSEDFDLIIGADGVRSVVRECLHGQGEFRFSGELCYRGVVPYRAPDVGLSREVYGGAGQRFGVHPISAEEVYFWATVPGRERLDLGGLRERYSGWGRARCAAGALLCNPVFDLEPLKQWGVGRVTLLGDAAHPTTPNLGQGATWR